MDDEAVWKRRFLVGWLNSSRFDGSYTDRHGSPGSASQVGHATCQAIFSIHVGMVTPPPYAASVTDFLSELARSADVSAEDMAARMVADGTVGAHEPAT